MIPIGVCARSTACSERRLVSTNRPFPALPAGLRTAGGPRSKSQPKVHKFLRSCLLLVIRRSDPRVDPDTVPPRTRGTRSNRCLRSCKSQPLPTANLMRATPSTCCRRPRKARSSSRSGPPRSAATARAWPASRSRIRSADAPGWCRRPGGWAPAGQRRARLARRPSSERHRGFAPIGRPHHLDPHQGHPFRQRELPACRMPGAAAPWPLG